MYKHIHFCLRSHAIEYISDQRTVHSVQCTEHPDSDTDNALHSHKYVSVKASAVTFVDLVFLPTIYVFLVVFFSVEFPFLQQLEFRSGISIVWKGVIYTKNVWCLFGAFLSISFLSYRQSQVLNSIFLLVVLLFDWFDENVRIFCWLHFFFSLVLFHYPPNTRFALRTCKKKTKADKTQTMFKHLQNHRCKN